MSKRFLIILAVLFAVFAGAVIFSKQKDSGQTGNSNSNGQVSSHIQGAGNKGVTIVEYGDFQCPACSSYFPIVEQIRQTYGDDITFQFVNFPLINIHQNAMAAHRAAEAASLQGKFWEMYALLYERQNNWNSSSNPSRIFEDYATELGLNIDQYKQDYNSAAVNDVINADIKVAQSLGATSTPTFVINGKKLDDLPKSYEEFVALIESEISQASQN